MSNPLIRPIEAKDHDRILEMNSAVVHWTSPMNQEHLLKLLSLSAYHRVIELDSQLAGFILAMTDSSGYDNANLNWFGRRCAHYLYIDRIVIAPEQAGAGLGRCLYEDVFDYAKCHALKHVVCEYSFSPLNTASRDFHLRMGFSELGRRALDASGKEVSMQAKQID